MVIVPPPSMAMPAKPLAKAAVPAALVPMKLP